MRNFPDFADLLHDLGLRGDFYAALVLAARCARREYWTWAETDDLTMALLMGDPLDNMAATHAD
jgi:hypothetical protein